MSVFVRSLALGSHHGAPPLNSGYMCPHSLRSVPRVTAAGRLDASNVRIITPTLWLARSRVLFPPPPAPIHRGRSVRGPTSDLEPFTAYLDKALLAGRAVGRIETATAEGTAYGTGFLVSPSLLLTNHHVLPDIDSARQSRVQFGYERAIDGALRAGDVFSLEPNQLFITAEAPDFP